MAESIAVSRLCFSARLVFPFVRALRKLGKLPPEVLDPLEELDPDDRIPISIVHELLAGGLVLSDDADIGLKAAREIVPGDYGAVEYLARSAPTWGSAAATVGRHMRLINDALRFSIEIEGDMGFIKLDSVIPLPRASADFQSGAFHVSATHFWTDDEPARFEAWFTHPEPADTREYALTFPGAPIRFDAPFNGFAFRRELMDMPVRGADPALHALIRKHAEALLSALPHAKNLTERVRDIITKQLAGGTPTLSNVAKQLGMSESTLARHLEDEGTTFKTLLEDLRRRLALAYIRRSELPISEIALLLGFSQAAAFHRAFRRWTGATPLEYRRAPVLPNP